MCLAQGPQRSDAGEARTRGPSVSSQALYHWATALPSYFFDLRLSIVLTFLIAAYYTRCGQVFITISIARSLVLHYNHYVSPSVCLLAVSENVYNSWNTWYISIIFCIHMHANIV